MTAPLPSVVVLPTKFLPGINALTDTWDEAVTKTVSFHDAMHTNWKSDAHFVSYRLASGNDHPRLNKAVLPAVRNAEDEVLTTMLVLDYDTPDHVVWTPDALQQWLNDLAVLSNHWPLAWQWSLLYTTRKGARLVYILDNPIPVDQSEARHQWLCNEFGVQSKAAGVRIEIDLATSDWTRVFRLPYVYRDGKPTWTDDVLFVEQLDNRLPVACLGQAEPSTRPAKYSDIQDFNEPQPDPDEVSDLLEITNTVTGRVQQTAWFKAAKRRLQGRDCFPCCFEHKPLAPQGDRDNAILRYVGSATSLLLNVPGTTPQHIYALFLDPVQQLDPDKDTPDWCKKLWNVVGRMWVREQAKVTEQQSVVQQQEVDSRNLGQRIVDGMRSWCDRPELHADPEAALSFASHHLLASVDARYYLMGPDGGYEPKPLTVHQLIPRIRHSGMDSLIATRQMSKDGAYIDKDVRGIINAHATIAYQQQAKPCIKQGYVENLGQQNAVFIEPSFSRNDDLEPTFNSDVHEWLRQLFGDNHARACDWIRWALAFEDGPICALSISGGQGVGKKLLCQGLSECLSAPKLAETADLTSDCQYGLLESPFLVVNEGWPRTFHGKHPADQFRALVGGDPVRINRKYLAPVTVSNPVRIILTANNLDLIRMLTANRDLSPEDRDALAVRLLHFDVGSQASAWFKIKGGRKFTARPGHRWIAGDGGEKSDFIVARHFLWLYSQRTTPPGDRFLVEGGNSESVMWEMRTQSGASPLVIETVIHLLNQGNLPTGITVEGGRVYVLISAVLGLYRATMSGSTRERLTASAVRSVFKGLMVAGSGVARILESRKKLGLQVWYELDTGLLTSVARRDGYTCPRLDDLVMGHEVALLRAADAVAVTK